MDYRLGSGKEQFPLFRCSECSLIFVNPMPSEKELPNLYPDDYYQPGMSFFKTVYSPLVKLNFKRILREIKKLRQDGKSLDIGCGNGELIYVVFS